MLACQAILTQPRKSRRSERGANEKPSLALSVLNPRRRLVERFSPLFRRQPTIIPRHDLRRQIRPAFGYTLSASPSFAPGFTLDYTLGYTLSPTLGYAQRYAFVPRFIPPLLQPIVYRVPRSHHGVPYLRHEFSLRQTEYIGSANPVKTTQITAHPPNQTNHSSDNPLSAPSRFSVDNPNPFPL